jgi:hypothetical protein
LKTKDKFAFLNKEITLNDIAEFLAIFKPAFKKSILLIALFTALFAVIGYFAKITSPKEFESTCVLYNELGGPSPNSSLQALALLTDANSGNGQGESSGGDLYQLILTNKPFLLELAKTPIYVNKQKKSITLEQYFDKELELDVVERSLNAITNIPSTVKGWMTNTPKVTFSKKSLISDTAISNQLKGSFANNVYIADLTAEDRKIIGILAPRIKLIQLGKLSTLKIKMPEAILSAEVNKVVLELLIKYAIRFKASKQLENVEFLEARTAEAEVKYRESQQKVARFKDNNYNVIFQSVQTQENILQNNFILYSGIYNQLVAQLEQAKIQLKKDSPLFTVVEPVYIPDQIATDNSKIVSFLIKGLLIGLLLSLYFFLKCYKAYKSITINN